MECRHCHQPIARGARVCHHCGRHQRFGALALSSTAVSMLVAVISVSALLWDRIQPVVAPERAFVTATLPPQSASEWGFEVVVVNHDDIVVAAPRTVFCNVVEDVTTVEILRYQYEDPGDLYSALVLSQGAASFESEEVRLRYTLAEDLLPQEEAARAVEGARGAFDCWIAFDDRHGTAETMAVSVVFEYFLGTAVVAAQEGTYGTDYPIEARLYFARSEVFGCGHPDPLPGEAC